MTIQAILFDHDGTLVDSEPTHWRLWRDALRPHGVTLTEDEYKARHAGMSTARNAADLAQRHAIGMTADALAGVKFAVTSDFLAKDAFPLMPGVREALASFSAAGLRLGIVTGAGRTGVEATLRAHALHGVFETIVTSDDVKRGKPAPECYLLAAERLGLAPKDCVAIEDTEHGVNAAAAAGIACLAVPNAMSRQHDFSRATAVFDGLAAAADWVRANVKTR